MKGEFSRTKAEDIAGQIFRALDKNKDEELTEDEFVEGARSSKMIMDILSSQ